MPKVIVNHTGICGGHHYKAGQVVNLPEEVIAALGNNAEIIEQPKKKPVQKQIEKAPEHKMMEAADAEKKSENV